MIQLLLNLIDEIRLVAEIAYALPRIRPESELMVDAPQVVVLGANASAFGKRGQIIAVQA